ncbi:MAG: P-loop NTPase [Candidatus Neomarinimicrobiota bacterium]
MNNKEVLNLLKAVQYPGFSRDIVSFGMISDIKILNDKIDVILNISTENDEKKNQVKGLIKNKLSPHFSNINIEIKSKPIDLQNSNLAQTKQPDSILEGVNHIIAVASGKGGVGKSTISANLASALVNEGKKVGLLDLDIYGPSLPITFGVNEQPQMTQSKKLIPIKKNGIKLMSFGFISGNDTPVIWRGPLVARMTEQFFRDVEWGNLDYLILDLPPGTGDIQLTLTQKLRITGALIVTTPQDIALADVRKGADMFKKVNTPVIGVIENMSGLILKGEIDNQVPFIIINDEKIKVEKDGKFSHKVDLFKSGGGIEESERLGVPLLGKIPISKKITDSTDDGIPISKSNPNSVIGGIFQEITQKIMKIIE